MSVHGSSARVPEICGRETDVEEATRRRDSVFAADTLIRLDSVRSAFGLALHMHQPTIPAGGEDLPTADLISNLEYMREHGDRRNRRKAAAYAECYRRMGDLIPDLVENGRQPRIMLDYSGNLLWAFEHAERADVLEKLRRITTDPRYQRNVEWLGTTWSHAVASSTPPEDFQLHMRAWQSHFLSLFGPEALSRVRGFSPPEMHLPNDPDVAYAYVEALVTCGYRWLLVQEDTVEQLDGSKVSRPHLPHRLVVRNASGRELSITALVKTQESNLELIVRMQPLKEARKLKRAKLSGVEIPQMVTQIGDGENSRTMLTKFPGAYASALESLGTSGVVMLCGTEYLEMVEAAGLKPADFIAIQPAGQYRLWSRVKGTGRDAVDRAVAELSAEDEDFHVEGGSWVQDRSWVRGYEGVLEPMTQLSRLFHERIDRRGIDPSERRYREALLYLLLSQTSCYRYWGGGRWTDYAREICRRGTEVLHRQF